MKVSCAQKNLICKITTRCGCNSFWECRTAFNGIWNWIQRRHRIAEYKVGKLGRLLCALPRAPLPSFSRLICGALQASSLQRRVHVCVCTWLCIVYLWGKNATRNALWGMGHFRCQGMLASTFSFLQKQRKNVIRNTTKKFTKICEMVREYISM